MPVPFRSVTVSGRNCWTGEDAPYVKLFPMKRIVSADARPDTASKIAAAPARRDASRRRRASVRAIAPVRKQPPIELVVCIGHAPDVVTDVRILGHPRVAAAAVDRVDHRAVIRDW